MACRDNKKGQHPAQQTSSTLGKHTSSKLPKFLYRCFDEEQHARRLLDGFVWVSTFSWLRETDRGRGDPIEATATYTTTLLDSYDTSPEMQARLRAHDRFGMVREPGFTILINAAPGGYVVNRRPSDGYVLCTSYRSPSSQMRASFGKHCVRIADPLGFIHKLAKAMAPYSPEYAADYVDYSGRDYEDEQLLPSAPHFLNTRGNEPEAEFRIWFAPPYDGGAIRPIEVHAAKVAQLCSLV